MASDEQPAHGLHPLHRTDGMGLMISHLIDALIIGLILGLLAAWIIGRNR